MTNEKSPEDSSQLFLLRVWVGEEDAEGQAVAEAGGSEGRAQIRLHGKVQHLLSGKAASFNGSPALLDLLDGMMNDE